MAHPYTYQRIGDKLVIEVQYVDGNWYRIEEDLTDNDDLCRDVDGSEEFEMDGSEEADYACPEFTLGLPSGYLVLTFSRGKGSNRKALCSALFGPGGWVGTYGEPGHAVVAAMRLEEKSGPVKGRGTGI